MAVIVAFIVIHVTLALLVPRSLIAMLTGGPVLKDGAAEATPVAAKSQATSDRAGMS
jgi:hypothetical protein